MKVAIITLLLVLSSWDPASGVGRALVVNGNIVVIRADGSRFEVTRAGVDRQPDLASDGKSVVFVRGTPDSPTEIWIARLGSRASEATPLVKPPIRINGRVFDQAFAPQFSPDNRTIYFLIPFAATTHAILKVDIDEPKPTFVAAALSFSVVPKGQYRGDLVAQVRKAKLAPGYYEWYWLLTPEGKEIGLVGQDDRDVELFLSDQD